MIPRVEPKGMLFRKPLHTFRDRAMLGGLSIRRRTTRGRHASLQSGRHRSDRAVRTASAWCRWTTSISSNAGADDLAKALAAGRPADRQDEEHLFADRAHDRRQAVLFDTGNGEAASAAEQGRARHAQRQSCGRRHRPQRHRPGGGLAFPRRPCERAIDAGQQPGISEGRNQVPEVEWASGWTTAR